jgi:hypothetical protein
MDGVFTAGSAFGVLAKPEADKITDGRPLVAFGKVATMKEDLTLAGLKKSVTLQVVPHDNLCGQGLLRRMGVEWPHSSPLLIAALLAGLKQGPAEWSK